MNSSKTPTVVAAAGATALTVARRWDRFWFRPGDATLLGLLRICCGLVALYVHFAYSFDLKEFFGPNGWTDLELVNKHRHENPHVGLSQRWDDQYESYETRAEEREYVRYWGVNPRQTIHQGDYMWSVWFHVTDDGWMRALHVGGLVVMFLFTIGFCTRLTSVLTWLMAMSYINRSMATLFGMDTMMNILLFYMMIGPSGAALSVDRLIMRWWATWRAVRSRKPVPETLPAPSLISAGLILRAIQVHLCFIYMASGLSKLQGQAWWNGTAIWMTVANYEFSPLYLGPYTTVLRFLCQHRPLWDFCMTGAVGFTFFVEIGFPFLVWKRRWTWLMIISAVSMHVGIATTMGLITFSLFMMVMVMSFLPPAAVQRFLWALGRGAPRLGLYYHGKERRQVRVASIVRALDIWDQVAFMDTTVRSQSSVEPSSLAQGIQARPPMSRSNLAGSANLHLITKSGEDLTGYPLFVHLVRSLRLLWPVALVTWIPGAGALGRLWFPPHSQEPASSRRKEADRPQVPAGKT